MWCEQSGEIRENKTVQGKCLYYTRPLKVKMRSSPVFVPNDVSAFLRDFSLGGFWVFPSVLFLLLSSFFSARMLFPSMRAIQPSKKFSGAVRCRHSPPLQLDKGKNKSLFSVSNSYMTLWDHGSCVRLGHGSMRIRSTSQQSFSNILEVWF